ncbi:hypothetical protein EUX98_g8377 [Antrodiella citrinella]|uniref:Uncharacterized protein n=1 Tax=Antrodiella citrinella TaxID=2447956 RepID=A0A4S4M7Y8_9APHY|nr:hypothetical protein EUX98_g8377 [Antrodiella citrinella]
MALHQLSLRQFATTASRLYEDNTGDFLSFVLSGEANDDNGDVQQYAVNALQGASPIIHDELEFSRDIDSIIGVTQTLPFKVPLSIFPIAPFSETLKKNSHITQPVLNPNGSHIAVELSKIPNFAFFKFGGRHVTRIFCPEANSSGWSGEPTVPTDLLKKFYEQCLRPAVEEVVIGGTVHWLPSYEAVYRRSRDHNSQLHFSSTDIPLESIPLFETALVTKMALIPKFNNFFFGHEIRGVKGATRHHPRDNVDREAAFDKVCDVLDPTRLNFGDWMVDVAIEVRWPQRVLLWKTDAHYKVVQRALGCDDDEARALMRSRHKTSVDLCAQLKELGGFRSHPGTLGLNRGVLYINVYTTDKAATYQLHQGDFERRRYTDVGPARLERLSRSVETTRDTFFDCAGVNSEQTGFDGATRFEIRVPLLSVNKTHYKLSRQFIDDTMVAFPTKTWW